VEELIWLLSKGMWIAKVAIDYLVDEIAELTTWKNKKH
jgi:hypothetical protein